MNSILSLVIGLFLQSTTASAVDCQKQFGMDVSSCSKSVNAANLSGQEKSEAHKACITDAKSAKVACLNGTNTCLNTCQTTYNSASNVCRTSYDPNQCSGEAICIEIMTAQRDECLATASSELQACNSSCY